MTISEQQVNEILEENRQRWSKLRAKYDPITGEGLEGDRVVLSISDYPIPVQWVPRKMLKNKFIKELAEAGSMRKFLAAHPGDDKIRSLADVERLIRKVRYKYDFPHWAYFCFPIKKKLGGFGRFKLNYPQLELNEVIQQRQDNGEPLDVIIVKARQWGGSTYSIAKQAHILLNLDHYHSFVVAAQVQTAANNILRMLKHAISEYPAWVLGLPDDTKLTLSSVDGMRTVYAIKDAAGNQVLPALIYIGSVKNPDSLRSQDVRGAHYSEVGVWENTPERRPEDLISSISAGIARVPYSMQVMESTAKSSDDFFHDMYDLAKKGHSNYKPLFIPWYHIPHDTMPIRDKVSFVKELLANKDNDNLYGRWRDTGKHYWWLWELGATLEGINWYREERLRYTRYSQMANEAPSTDVEAFQAAGNHVFDIYQVEAMRKWTKPPRWIGHLYSNDRRDKGVLENIQFREQSNGNLKIWEMPDYEPISNRYLVVVDIGGANPTSDFHSARVFDRLLMMPQFNGKPTIVAEMHYHCLRDDLAYDVAKLAKWYNDALLVIESNTYEMGNKERNIGGDGSQYILDVIGELYPNLYARENSPEEIEEGKPRKWGFRTDHSTKPKIIDLMQWAVAEQQWIERCNNCLDELSLYIEHDNKFDAPPHKHDDELMATAIGLWVCFREMPLPKFIEKKKQPTTRKNTLVNF